MPCRRPLAHLLTTVILLACVRTAAAEKPPGSVRNWYGWQILATDLAGWGLFLLSDYSEETAPDAEIPLKLAGGATLALGAPAVHIAQGRSKAAFISLALRTVVPLGVGVIAAELSDREDGGIGAGLTGAVVTLVVAHVIDWTLLSHGKQDSVDRRGSRWGPTMVLSPSGGGLGIAGSF